MDDELVCNAYSECIYIHTGFSLDMRRRNESQEKKIEKIQHNVL